MPQKSVLHIEIPTKESMDRGSPEPRTLAAWREYFQTHKMELEGPDGTNHTISLEPWDNAPDDTLLAIYAVWLDDPERIGTKDPDGGPR